MAGTLVVSQPMFLPWIGLFEQIKLSSLFVHYDDVQAPLGRSFLNRVQIKTKNGSLWLTAPLDGRRSGPMINETRLLSSNWRKKHLDTIRHAYARTPYFEVMFDLVEKIYNFKTDNLAEFNINGIELLAKWLTITCDFRRSSQLGIPGASTQRLVDLCLALHCNEYVTGHGACNYLEHERFEKEGCSVRYMNYKKIPYAQQYGEFTPFVSIIDAIANCGDKTPALLVPETLDWRTFVCQQKKSLN